MALGPSVEREAWKLGCCAWLERGEGAGRLGTWTGPARGKGGGGDLGRAGPCGKRRRRRARMRSGFGLGFSSPFSISFSFSQTNSNLIEFK